MSLYPDEKILDVLMQYNPWWKDGRVPDSNNPPEKRYAFYEIRRILERQDLRRFAILSGARRVGKTTILYQLISDLLVKGVPPRNIVYLSFDNPIIKLAGFHRVLQSYDTAFPVSGQIYFFFDEVQYAEDWQNWVKVLYDQRPALNLVATGSASPLLENGTADSGVGRWQLLKLPTLSFYEYCELLRIEGKPDLPMGIRPTQLHKLEQADLSELMAKLAPLSQHLNRYLMVGGFPELALASSDREAQKILREDVVDKVIKRDVLMLFNVRNPLQLEKVFLYLCLHSSGIINFTTMSQELDDMNKGTLANYVQFLKQSNLIYVSDPIGLGGKAVLKSRPKIYIADAAIRNAVLMQEDATTDPVEMGAMVETAIYKHIASFYYQTTSQVGYYRSSKGNQKEIDVVVQLPRGRILCEIKYRENSQITERDAIIEMARLDQANILGALIITKKPEDYGTSKHETRIPVMRIPAAAFLYLLGKAEAEGFAAKM